MPQVQDVVVIGGGAGGFAAAIRAAQLGGRVTVVESAHYGGTCMNQGCIPLTFLMTAAHLLHNVRKAGQFGIRVESACVDMAALHERKELIVESLRLGTEQLLADHGVTLIAGRGRLASPTTVEVGGQQIQARSVVMATGSVEAPLPIPGADLPGVIGTQEALALSTPPQRLAVLGDQPWDIELAQYFQALGSQVTLVAGSDPWLPDADRSLGQRLGQALRDSGISIRRGARAEAIRQAQDGALAVVLAGGAGEVVADQVLAARRLPNSTGLGLRDLGVATRQGAVPVNERMETTVPHLYAIGDLTPGPLGSHKAGAEGVVAAENAMGRASRMEYRLLPHGLYTWPQAAWVGLTEEQAEAQGLEVRVGEVPMAVNPQAMILDETAGMVKIVAGRHGKLLGAHIVSPGAVDLIDTFVLAMLSEATAADLMRIVARHPSLGEAVVDAALDVDKRALHLPRW